MTVLAAGAAPPPSTVSSDFDVSAPAGDIMTGLDGSSLTLGSLTAALRSAGELADDHAVLDVEVVPGSELRWPQSHSAKLRLASGPAVGESRDHRTIYLKKVIAKGLPPKPLSALRRDLASNRNEARFYKEFAPVLARRGLPALRAFLVDERIDVGDSSDGLPDESPKPSTEDNSLSHEAAAREETALRTGGMLLLLESADGYWQTSPLDAAHAAKSLQLLAKLHAFAWQDTQLLSTVAARLHRLGGYWTLDKRGEAEMRRMREHWQQYLTDFEPLAPELLRRRGIVELAARVERLAPWVARELAPTPHDQFATLIHGDYKAMNIFLREEEGREESAQVDNGDSTCKRRKVAAQGEPAVPIDFQWTGLGFGMSDVAMHLSHSVAVAALEGAGERALVELYHRALLEAAGRSRMASYTMDVAWRHYCLAVVDYARMVLGCFFKDASQSAFAARSKQPNVGLAYRDVNASLLFVERVDRCLTEVERWAP